MKRHNNFSFSYVRSISVIFFVFFFLAFLPAASLGAGKTVRIGVYNFEPLIGVGDAGKPHGLFIDVVEHVAEREEWNISYVPGTWNECLERLKASEIDLLPGIVYSEERAKSLDFSEEYLFLDWGVVYVSPKSPIKTVLDLHEKRVAVLKGDIYTEGFLSLVEQFGIDVEVYEKGEYAQVFSSVMSGEVDAGINAQLSGSRLQEKFPVKSTQIYFSPEKLRFASPKNRYAETLSALDTHIRQLKGDESSYCYGRLVHYTGGAAAKPQMPKWAVYSLYAGLVGLVLLISVSIVLRRLVYIRTRALARSEARFRDVAESMSDWIWETDVNGVYTYVSPKVERVLGYASEEILGKTPFDLMPADEVERVGLLFQAIAKNKQPIRDLENWNFTRDGRRVCLLTNGIPLLGEDGELVGYRGVDRDITERKYAEMKLFESESRYRAIFDNMIDVGYRTDVEGKFVFISPSSKKVLGYTPDELIGTEIKGLYREPAQRDVFASSLTTQGSVEGFEAEVRRKDGSFIWVCTNAKILTDDSGEAVGVEGITRDITDRKLAEIALSNAEKLFRTFMDAYPSAMFIKDLEGRFTYLNKATKELYGSGEDSGIGKTSQEFHHNDYAEAYAAHDREVMETGLIVQKELKVISKDGTVRDAIIVKCPLRNEAGEIVSIGGITIDITEQKMLEKQLIQTQKLEAIGTLAGGIAHDFNNILAAIVGYTELTLDETEEGSNEQKNLSAVLTAAQKATELVKQIRMFSRKDDEGKEPIQIHMVVEEAARLLRLAIPVTIAINTEIDHHTGVVLADATQMHQIVMNLGTNACHAMRKAGGELTISLEPVEVDQTIASKYQGLQEGPFALLTVTDTGAGMDPVTMSRIFDPFFTTKDIGEGTGMGLSVVHGILQNHGGAIGVESSLGAGATFKIFLPLVQKGDAKALADI